MVLYYRIGKPSSDKQRFINKCKNKEKETADNKTDKRSVDRSVRERRKHECHAAEDSYHNYYITFVISG